MDILDLLDDALRTTERRSTADRQATDKKPRSRERLIAVIEIEVFASNDSDQLHHDGKKLDINL